LKSFETGDISLMRPSEYYLMKQKHLLLHNNLAASCMHVPGTT